MCKFAKTDVSDVKIYLFTLRRLNFTLGTTRSLKMVYIFVKVVLSYPSIMNLLRQSLRDWRTTMH